MVPIGFPLSFVSCWFYLQPFWPRLRYPTQPKWDRQCHQPCFLFSNLSFYKCCSRAKSVYFLISNHKVSPLGSVVYVVECYHNITLLARSLIWSRPMPTAKVWDKFYRCISHFCRLTVEHLTPSKDQYIVHLIWLGCNLERSSCERRLRLRSGEGLLSQPSTTLIRVVH